jgi:hypothetical protein
MSAPQPVARCFRELIDRYGEHPGATWVRRMYHQHRGARSDFDGPARKPQMAERSAHVREAAGGLDGVSD